MKIIVFPLALLLMLSSCSNKNKPSELSSNADSLDTEVLAQGEDIPELTETRCKELVSAIPDHGELNDPESTLCSEYYSTWKEAWEIPDGGLGDIGNNEFLFYFVCGNDPCPSHTATIRSMDVDGETALVKFFINHTYEYMDNPLHTFKLIVENGRWVIADYDNTLSEMREYISSQREYLKSAEYRKRAEDILNDSTAEENWKEAVRQELEEVESYLP